MCIILYIATFIGISILGICFAQVLFDMGRLWGKDIDRFIIIALIFIMAVSVFFISQGSTPHNKNLVIGMLPTSYSNSFLSKNKNLDITLDSLQNLSAQNVNLFGEITLTNFELKFIKNTTYKVDLYAKLLISEGGEYDYDSFLNNYNTDSYYDAYFYTYLKEDSNKVIETHTYTGERGYNHLLLDTIPFVPHIEICIWNYKDTTIYNMSINLEFENLDGAYLYSIKRYSIERYCTDIPEESAVFAVLLGVVFPPAFFLALPLFLWFALLSITGNVFVSLFIITGMATVIQLNGIYSGRFDLLEKEADKQRKDLEEYFKK